ncbi:MAG: hypothetical protein N4A71_07615 [Carboxylicivirga sp.]|jgi:2-oxoglutarate dehydrogenase complex dehydrogenase (E1) component-like enzyme|nr:hypothetical protein [Carboxylicivirga sp.]MCT4644509.1 hypothetical protein [Carboxylicivirga sp.]
MDTKGKMMITCKEATFLISKKQQDRLNFFEKMQLRLHLMMCKYCRRFSIQVNFMTKAIQRMKNKVEERGVEIKLNEEQKKRLRRKITEAEK